MTFAPEPSAAQWVTLIDSTSGRVEYSTRPLQTGEAGFGGAVVGDPSSFDDEFFDAEILVERAGLAYFYRDDLAEFLGILPGSVWTMITRGLIPAPHHHEWVTNGRRLTQVAVWTPAQAAEAVVLRRRAAKPPAECGTSGGYSRHRRRNEAPCEACKEARADTRRSQRTKVSVG